MSKKLKIEKIKTLLKIIVQELYLEEVVFQKVSHRFVSGNSPPTIQIEVQGSKPHYQNQSRQLGLVANRNKQHEDGSNNILKNLKILQ